MLFSEILAVTKTTSKYIAGLQDPFKEIFMNGKSNYKLKSLKINDSCKPYNVRNEKIVRINSFCPFSP